MLDYIKNKKVDLVINIPKNLEEKELDNDYAIRRAAVDFKIPLITDNRVAREYLYSVLNIALEDISIRAWEEY